MISAVFDATTLLQAAASKKGPAGACLTFVDAGAVKLFLSAVTIDEIRDVLHRPELRKTLPKLTVYCLLTDRGDDRSCLRNAFRGGKYFPRLIVGHI